MEGNSKILIVDDEEDIREIVEIYLINEGFEVTQASNGIEALKVIEKQSVDLIILDIMMPEMDGIKTCLQIRKDRKIPIIMLSAKAQDSDKILGLNIGADDYLVKPFNPLELVARVKSQLRRATSFNEGFQENENTINIESLIINKYTREVFVEGKFVRLTPREFDILEVLAINRGRVLSTEQIYEKVWKEPFYNSENTVAVHIRNIREKIEINPKEPKYIKLVWGVGYKIDKIQ